MAQLPPPTSVVLQKTTLGRFHKIRRGRYSTLATEERALDLQLHESRPPC